MNARKYTHAMAIATRAAAGSHLGDRNFRSTVGSWRKSRVAGEKSKMKAAIRRAQGQSSMRGERIRNRARCHARLYSVRRANGVDRRGYARGQITREEGYGKKKKACRHDDGQIARGEAEEHAGDDPARRQARRNANRDPEQCQGQRLAQNQPTNAALLRPERDANTDSARAAGDAVGHRPIKANRSKQQREGGERRVSKLTWSFEDTRAHICDH